MGRPLALAAILAAVVVATALVVARGDRPPDVSSSQRHSLTTGWFPLTGTAVALPHHSLLSGDAAATSGAHVVLLNFWASTCAPCKHELPLLESLNGHGVTVAGVDRDQYARYGLRSLQRAGVTYPNWFDPDGHYARTLAALVPIRSIPVTLVLVDGRAEAVHLGALTSEADLRREVRELTAS